MVEDKIKTIVCHPLNPSEHYKWDVYAIGDIYDDRDEVSVVINDIKEHRPMGDGDHWFWDLILSDGQTVRIFNVERAYYKKEEFQW